MGSCSKGEDYAFFMRVVFWEVYGSKIVHYGTGSVWEENEEAIFEAARFGPFEKGLLNSIL